MTSSTTVTGPGLVSSSVSDLSPQVSDKPLIQKNNSQSSSLISVDFENDNSEMVSERLISPFDEAMTSSSNLSLSSTSRVDNTLRESQSCATIVRNGSVSLSNGTSNYNLSKSIPLPSRTSITTPNGVESSKSTTICTAQRSKSFHSDFEKKSLKRNPSMLYYFTKSPLRLKFKPANDKNSSNLLNDEVQFENTLNTSEDIDTEKYSSGGELIIDPPAILAAGEQLSHSVSLGIVNPASTNTAADTSITSSFIYRPFSKSEEGAATDAVDPSQYHGPEFVIRSRDPPKLLSLTNDKNTMVCLLTYLCYSLSYMLRLLRSDRYS